MKTSCPHCGKEYAFDDNKVPRDVVPVKCSVCGNVFNYRKGVGAEVKSVGTSAAGGGGDDVDTLVEALKKEKERILAEEKSGISSLPPLSDDSGDKTDKSESKKEEKSSPAPGVKVSAAGGGHFPSQREIEFEGADDASFDLQVDELEKGLDDAVAKIQQPSAPSQQKVNSAVDSAPPSQVSRPSSTPSPSNSKPAPVHQKPRFDIHTSMRADPAPPKKKIWPLVLIVALAIGGLGYGAYYFYFHKRIKGSGTLKSKGQLKSSATSSSSGSTLDILGSSADISKETEDKSPLDIAVKLYKQHTLESYAQAAKFFDKALSENSENPKVLAGLALVYAEKGRILSRPELLKKSFELATRAVRADESSWEAHTAMAAALAYSGKYDAAMAEARKADDLAGEAEAGPVYIEGLAYWKGKKLPGKAAKKFREALKRDKTDPRARAALTEIYVEKGSKKSALASAKHCMSEFSDNPHCLLASAKAFETAGQWTKAAGAWKSLFSLGVRSEKFVLRAASDYLSAQKPSKAERVLKKYSKVVKSRTGKNKRLYLLAKAYAAQGKTKASVSVLERLVKSSPNFISARNLLGDMYFKQKRYLKAAAQFKKSLSLNPSSLTVRKNLGISYYRAGKYRDAERVFKSMLKKSKGRQKAVAYYYLALIQEKRGSKRNAKIYLRRALRADRGYKNARIRLKKLGG